MCIARLIFPMSVRSTLHPKTFTVSSNALPTFVRTGWSEARDRKIFYGKFLTCGADEGTRYLERERERDLRWTSNFSSFSIDAIVDTSIVHHRKNLFCEYVYIRGIDRFPYHSDGEIFSSEFLQLVRLVRVQSLEYRIRK